MLASTTTLFKTGGPLSHLTSSPASDESPIVFVVDDDASVRRALLRLLKSEDLEAEGFETATAFLERDPPNRPSCLVLDLRRMGPRSN